MVDVDMFCGNQLQQAEASVRTPKAALLNSAPGRLSHAVGVNHFVDHHSSRFDLLGQSSTARDVLAPHPGRQNEYAIVGQLDGFVVSAKSNDGQGWTKDIARGRRLAEQIEAGTVMVNEVVYTHGVAQTP